MRFMVGSRVCLVIASIVLAGRDCWCPGHAAEYQPVLTALGQTGDFKDGVLKVNVPRSDLHVTIAARPAPTPFGFGGWLAMTKGDGGHEVLMGDLVLTEDEVSPVMSALLENGLEVTALHNHFFWEQPRIFYMHVHGMGDAADLARRAAPALRSDREAGSARRPRRRRRPRHPPPPRSMARRSPPSSGTPASRTGPSTRSPSGGPTSRCASTAPSINARMGLNTWAAFAGTDADAMVAGDVAMLESEVTPVVKALRAAGPERRGHAPPHARGAAGGHLPALLRHRAGRSAGARRSRRGRSAGPGSEVATAAAMTDRRAQDATARRAPAHGNIAGHRSAVSSTNETSRINRREFGVLLTAGAALQAPRAAAEAPATCPAADYVPPPRPLVAEVPPFSGPLAFTPNRVVPRVEPFPMAQVRLLPGTLYHDAQEWNRGTWRDSAGSAAVHLPSERRTAGGRGDAVRRLGTAGKRPAFERTARTLHRPLSFGERAPLRLHRRDGREGERRRHGGGAGQLPADGWAAHTSALSPRRGGIVSRRAKRVWAPFYTIHKIMAGLLDMYQLAGNTQALDVLEGMAAWVDAWTAPKTDAHMQQILESSSEGSPRRFTAWPQSRTTIAGPARRSVSEEKLHQPSRRSAATNCADCTPTRTSRRPSPPRAATRSRATRGSRTSPSTSSTK